MKTELHRVIVRRLSLATLTIVALLLPAAAARADNIFVANGGNNTIEEFTAGGVGTVYASTGLNNPNGLAFDAAGNLFVGNYGNNTIEKITPGGVSSVFATGLAAPYGMVFDASGNLYVANALSSQIVKFTPNGASSVYFYGQSEYGTYPIGLAFGILNNTGNLYESDNQHNFITEISPDGGSYEPAGRLNSPQGLAFDKAGNLYVANFGNGTPGSGYIEKYTTTSPLNWVGSVFASGLYDPCGLAFDSAGDLFATSRGATNNLIYEFSPAGAESVFASTGLNAPEFIAVQATPEPSVLMLALVGAASFVYLRRRK
jgi:sugar lactone lactonase YvrE